MQMFSKNRIKTESKSILAIWSGAYSDRRRSSPEIIRDAVYLADQFVAAYSLRNADKITLEIWRQYRHVLPGKKDVKTANIKKLINAVRRQMVRHKNVRKQINITAKESTDDRRAWRG